MKTILSSLLLALSCWAAPVHITLQGVISRIDVDSLGLLDSLGLRLGSVLNFSFFVDYAVQPVDSVNGLTRVVPDDTAPDGERNDYFVFRFQDTSLARNRVAGVPTEITDYGLMHWNVVGPSAISLRSYRLWGALGSTLFMSVQSETGILSDTYHGYGGELFGHDTTTLLRYYYNIQNVNVEGSNAVLRPRGFTPAAEESSIWRGTVVIPLGGNRFLVNGRRLEMGAGFSK